LRGSLSFFLTFFCIKFFFANYHVKEKVVSSQIEVLQILFKNFTLEKQDTIGA
jgi:hypothetical protein